MDVNEAIKIVRSKLNKDEKIKSCFETDTEYVFTIFFGEYYPDSVDVRNCSVNKKDGKYTTYDFWEYMSKYDGENIYNFKYIDVKEGN